MARATNWHAGARVGWGGVQWPVGWVAAPLALGFGFSGFWSHLGFGLERPVPRGNRNQVLDIQACFFYLKS